MQGVEERAGFRDFSLLGGPLHRLGSRLGLVRGGTNSVALGLALGLGPWTILAALAFIEGIGRQVFSLEVIGAHARLLLAIPLFFVCEAWLDPRLTAFVRTIVRSGIVPAHALPALESETGRIGRWRDAWLPEALCLAAAVLLTLAAPHLALWGTTAARDLSRAVPSLTGEWYWFVCMTLFRFLLLRCLWRLGLWWTFLWRLARLDLHLVPTHPDGAAGLGYLEFVHIEFAPLAMAMSVVLAASLAEDISAGKMAFEAIFPLVALVLAVDAALFLAPLFIFAPKLWLCRAKGLSDYMEFAARYVNDFDRKWLGAGAVPQDSPLGTADLQSLADLSNSVNVVRDMRLVPVSQRLLTSLAAAALLPLLPLLLLKYPVAELAGKLFKTLLNL